MAWDGHPEMLLRDEALLQLMHYPESAEPGVMLELHHPDGHDCRMIDDSACFTGAIFKDGTGLIYRVGEYDLETNCWHARWPD